MLNDRSSALENMVAIIGLIGFIGLCINLHECGKIFCN